MTFQLPLRARAATMALLALAVSACTDAPLAPVDDGRVVLSADVNANDALKADLGELIFKDARLSLKQNQSCASCHDERFGFTAPNSAINNGGAVMPGSVAGRFGTRRPPTAAYASFSPNFHFEAADDAFVGGVFWDGRATGNVLGSPVADQAMAPFTNSVEMALPDIACVVWGVRSGTYLTQFRAVWGDEIMQIVFPANTATLCGQENVTVPLSPTDRARAQTQFVNAVMAIATFEGSPKMNKFSSRYDAYVDGVGTLTADELKGLDLFENKAGCAACHPSEGSKALFTDFTYDNIGVPANLQNPRRVANGFIDLGLGGILSDESLHGAQKVPTLRNLDKRPPYGAYAKSFMHNGVFKSLEQVVHFYNTRDVLPRCIGNVPPSDARFGKTCWPAPEVNYNVNVDELGDLGLTAAEEKLLVLYLKTLSDR